MESDPVTRYCHTHRIVLLIDVAPLHHHPCYTQRLISFFQTLLSFPPLSSSLFAFKLFFSSLSPLLSFSKLQPYLSNPSLSFDHPSSTLVHLSHTLSSLPSFHPFSTPDASHLAENLSQILHDHSWEHHDHTSHTPRAISPNLVLLFSPSFTSFTSLSSFFNTDANLIANPASLYLKFSLFFGSVSRAFRSRGIHCSWISIDGEIEGGIESNENNEGRELRCLFETGVGRLGWGFCSLDSVLFGSAVVPFGLVYPKIGVSLSSLCCSSRGFNVGGQLSLRILDVSGSPIEYNCCDLEFVDLKVNSELANLRGCERREGFRKMCLEGGVKLEVKVVRRCDGFVELEEWLCDSIMVRERFGGLKKKEKGDLDGCFADRVLELVASEFGCQWQRKLVPVWEMLLSFLYREGCWALVSVTNAKGGSCLGILRPFTVFAALFSVLGDPNFGEANVGQYIRMVDDETCKSDGKHNENGDLLDSQVKKSAVVVGVHQRKKINLNTLRDITWSSFCKLVYDQFDTDLLDVYYTMEGNKSKKLKFLKCWMKQMKKSGFSDLTLLEKPKPDPLVAGEAKSRLNDLPQNGEQPISSFASAEVNLEPEESRMQEDADLDFRSETSETFFSSLADRINRGIESESVDMGALAVRLVNSSIYWLCQKIDRETISQSQSPSKDHKACGSMIASELIKLLLREPKEIAAKHKSQNPFSQSQAFDSEPVTPVTELVVKEYELQILFRMEILQSEVGSGVEDSCKRKFVKQICLLLENIQCHMGMGFFGDWTLENYVTKIIKNRYSLTLEDMVQKIYNKMDLLLFADEDEAPNSLLNSEDSNKSLNKRAYRDEKDGSGRFQRIVNGEHDKRLIEAKERRERARRFSSCRSWKPVLRRVWAPKQMGMKSKIDPLQRVPKRKERERASYGTVCETPMTGNKHSSPRIRGSEDNNNGLADGSQRSGSVSKALFKDDL
ncbi:uncharacterized protein LOC109789931 isoform X2 [Cajanus cajan]|uniref:uncharacterized protein LOC109789931 isoform X2 n=1 Tax=Cajanus cajan TaxID=3821 RepID=UPI00098DC084|nr:uncharacterized protein LOC109789931 isoform X2 [Cajanus cajan]